MDAELTLELITHGKGLGSNLVPVHHENSKIWPHQKLRSPAARPSRSFPAHELLAEQAPGIVPCQHADEYSIASHEDWRESYLDPVAERRVSLANVGALLSHCSSDFQDIKRGFVPQSELKIYLLAWCVADLATGSYYYWQPGRKLIAVRKLEENFSWRRIILDPAQGRMSAGLIVLSGHVRYDGFEDGERYYRDLLITTGAMLEGLARTASSLALNPRIILNFLDDPLAMELGLDPWFEQPLAAMAFGPVDNIREGI